MPQYAILRFEKHKGTPARAMEAHHERQKEKYASNPDIDTAKSKNNFHIVKPQGKYYHFIQSRIEQAGCRTRKNSTRFVDTLITASPEFFKGKSIKETAAFFQRAADFLIQRVGKENIISAVVHMDVKYSIVLMVYGVYRVREKRRIGTSYTNRKKNVYDVTWKRIRKILKSGIGSGSF